MKLFEEDFLHLSGQQTHTITLLEKIMTVLDDLTTTVAGMDAAVDQAIALLNKIPGFIAAAGIDPTKLAALQTDLKAKTAALVAAIAADTPALVPAAPAPAPVAPVAPAPVAPTPPAALAV